MKPKGSLPLSQNSTSGPHPEPSQFMAYLRKLFFLHPFEHRSWDSSVSIETKLWTGWPGLDSWQGQGRKCFTSSPHPDQLWGPPILPSSGYQGLLPQR